MFDMTKPFKNFDEQVDIILGREMRSRELDERELREEIKQSLLIMCALRKFFESSTCAGEFSGSVIMMTACCHDF